MPNTGSIVVINLLLDWTGIAAASSPVVAAGSGATARSRSPSPSTPPRVDGLFVCAVLVGVALFLALVAAQRSAGGRADVDTPLLRPALAPVFQD